MLAAIHFHDQRFFQAGEIQDVIQKRMLAAKLAALDPGATQSLP